MRLVDLLYFRINGWIAHLCLQGFLLDMVQSCDVLVPNPVQCSAVSADDLGVMWGCVLFNNTHIFSAHLSGVLAFAMCKVLSYNISASLADVFVPMLTSCSWHDGPALGTHPVVALSVLVSVDDDVLNCINADSNVRLYLTTSVLHITS